MKFHQLIMLITPIAILLIWLMGCQSSTDTDSTPCEVLIEPTNIELLPGNSTNLSAELNEGCSNQEIKWESSNQSIVTIISSGNNSAKLKAKKEGDTEVQACSEQNPEECDKSNVKVYELDVAFMGRNHDETTGTENDDIYVTTSEEKGFKKRVTTHPEQDAVPIEWTNNGEKIIFASYRTEGPSIFTVDAKKGENDGIKNLTRNLNFAYNPDLSPDGNYLVMQARKTKDDYMEIFKFNLETEEATRLTFEKIKSGSHPNNPDWSPDGEKIAYSSARTGEWEIYVMHSDGSNKTNITQTPNQGAGYPSWSPNGEKIAYTVGGEGIYVMDSDGSNKTKLGPGVSPEWTPDGKIVFTISGNSLYIMNSDGSNVETIATKSDFEDLRYIGYPSWKPK